MYAVRISHYQVKYTVTLSHYLRKSRIEAARHTAALARLIFEGHLDAMHHQGRATRGRAPIVLRVELLQGLNEEQRTVALNLEKWTEMKVL